MRWAGALPSIKNVRGRSPRPIWVTTSSTCRHGAIHLRQTIKAITLNAPQIRTPMSQDTVFYSLLNTFCSKAAAKAFRNFTQVLVRQHCFLRQVWSARPPHTTFAPTPLLFPKPIPKTPHCFNRVASFTELFAQSTHVRVHGPGVDHTFITPDVV